jgi:hypothetical protein
VRILRIGDIITRSRCGRWETESSAIAELKLLDMTGLSVVERLKVNVNVTIAWCEDATMLG